ncbi:MAG: heparan N-sulfatase [Verrucomicrobiales bacterium]|nr:heparan N-sulfatase [Verrucomicrobiales bacterium]|tara:strand:+ start:19621 stop:21420 length:1800 start_codon:yes stop_codon:yes gene_type:complete
MLYRVLLFCTLLIGLTSSAEQKPNILFITVDDMSADSIGVYGCKLKETTPHIDALAREGLRFKHAHVVVGNCMPSRNCMLSGRYPHNNGVEGFYQIKEPDYPVLADLMKANGYLTAIRGKVSHSTPYSPFPWDLILDDGSGKREHPKDVESYYRSTMRGIEASRAAGKPYCMLINISDPHKPFYGVGKGNRRVDDPHKPSRIYEADEVPVPGFLPDHPAVREELALYYTTVRRADDCVGAVMRAFREVGDAENTAIFFLSDHGMPLPFAKTAVYHHSTHTPLIVQWLGATKKNIIDTRHMVSGVDILPTFLEVAGIKQPAGIDGRSFVDLLRGHPQSRRDAIFKEYNENSGAGRHPMRSVQTRRFGYIFNPWADGKRVFKTATTGTATYRTMKQLAETDPKIAARVDLFEHRALEEFYDYENDPDALNNLIDDPKYQKQINEHRRRLEHWLKKTSDHALEPFQNRNKPEQLLAYMTRVETEAAERRKEKLKNKQKSPRRNRKLMVLIAPEKISAGSSATIGIEHKLPKNLGEQMFHVTLKIAGKRADRKVLSALGKGNLEITFEVPESASGKSISFAAFVGKDYSSNLQHLASKPIKVK